MNIDLRQLDAVFAEFTEPGSPGCAVAVIEAGRVLTAKGYGLANLEYQVPIHPETRFDIGSVSKQFTAACTLLLANDGLFGLDDDIRKHLPELPDAPFDGIRVRELIHHTSGIPDYLNLMVMSGRQWDNDYSADEILDLIARQEHLDFAPASRHAYSNSGYFLLSLIIERCSGQPLRIAADERIFGPLGMADTFFRDDYSEVITRRAVGYAPSPSGTGLAISMPNLDLLGDGAVITTVNDLALWDAQFYDCTLPGGSRFIEQLLTVGTLADGSASGGYAFGLYVDEHRGGSRTQHSGGWGGYRAQLVRLHEQRLTVAVLSNLATANTVALADQVVALVLDEEEGTSDTARYAFDLKARLGTYSNADLGLAVEIVVGPDGHPSLEVAGQKVALTVADESTLSADGLGLRLVFSPQGGYVIATLPGQGDVELHRATAEQPSEQQLLRLTGIYQSRELRSSCRVEHAGASLQARFGWLPWTALSSLGDGRFIGDGLLFSFVDNGTDVHLDVAAPRSRNQQFEREPEHVPA